MVSELLAAHGVQRRDLNGIAFGAGPGAFTGVRIACGVAQGIAFGGNCTVAGITTLHALAEAAQMERVICCLDARMGEIYHAAYVRDGDGWREVCSPSLCKPEDAPMVEGDGWHGCGSGFAEFGAQLRARYGVSLAGVIADVVPHAREVAVLGARVFAQGGAVAPEFAAPLYVRNKVALLISERSKPVATTGQPK